MPWVPRNVNALKDWPADGKERDEGEVIRLYEQGYAGALPSPEEWERFQSEQPEPNGEDVAHRYGLAETGAGKLAAPFVSVLETFPGCWPGAVGQAFGDCVSWGARNGTLTTLVGDIISGQPDQKTGKVEGVPEGIPEEGVRHGVLSTEAIYWWRGYSSHGWHCPSAARVVTQTSGAFLRKDYPELGVDLTRYTPANCTKYGSRKPPDGFKQIGGQRLVHTATEAQSVETLRDMLYNGYGCIDCGGEGFASTRNEHGVSQRQGSWAHSMCPCAVDDRPWAHQTYGGPLVLILNSWAKWNRGPRDIHDSAVLVPAEKKQSWIDKGIVNPATGNILIPEGSFWARWKDVSRREFIIFGGIAGWEKRDVDPLVVWS